MEEIWKLLPIDNSYAVSNLGRVKTLPRLVKAKNGKKVPFNKANRILKAKLSGFDLVVDIGSPTVSRKKYKVKFLVFLTFVNTSEAGKFIINLDGDPFNCCLNNLCLKSIFDIHEVSEKDFVPIKGYENYLISKTGVVLNTENGNKVALVYSIANRCLAVRLWKNNTTKLFYLYRLLAISFIPNSFNKPQINHIDGNRMNISLDNLEWVTASENMKHAVKIGIAKGQFEKGVNNRFRHLKTN